MALEKLLETVKETFDNLSSMSKAGYLALFTALMPACSGDTTYNYYNYDGVQALGCVSDSDCRDEEKCHFNRDLEANICYNPSGSVADYSGSDGGTGDGACGGSPLVGKYLHDVPGCDYGMSNPISNDGRGTFLHLRDGSIWNTFIADGCNLTFDHNLGSLSPTNRVTLYSSVSVSSLSTIEACFPDEHFTAEQRSQVQGWQEGLIGLLQCYMERGGPGIFYFAPNGLICPSGSSPSAGMIFRVDNNALSTKDECEELEGGREGTLEWERYCKDN
ncbi:MAG: hypothetical protein ABIH82_00965 [Candidatus Woesearchaeota archaeon]